MKKSILVLSFIMFAIAAYSQQEISMEAKTAKKLNNQEKKELRKIEKEAKLALVDDMLTNRQFYFEVSYVSESSSWIDVNNLRTYIAIGSDQIVMQVEPNTFLANYWGNNNLPVRGDVIHYKISKLDRSDEGYFVQFRTSGRCGDFDVSMIVSPSGKAHLKMFRNNGMTINFQGVLIPLDQTLITANFL